MNDNKLKMSEKESQEIKYYYDRIENGKTNLITYLPYIMKIMGQYLTLSEENEILKLVETITNPDIDDLLNIANNHWKDMKSSIENAIRDLDIFDTGVIKLDYFMQTINDYGEPLDKENSKQLAKFLFGQKEEITCSDAIKIILKSSIKKKKKKTRIAKNKSKKSTKLNYKKFTRT